MGMTEAQNQKYERRIKEADSDYKDAVAKLKADFQEKLKPFDKTYEYFVQHASEYRDQMVQRALNQFDADTAQLRADLEAGIAAASHAWGEKVKQALDEWHEGMAV
jgi:F0F1-type ATP synthase membrane subunit b/b'